MLIYSLYITLEVLLQVFTAPDGRGLVAPPAARKRSVPPHSRIRRLKNISANSSRKQSGIWFGIYLIQLLKIFRPYITACAMTACPSASAWWSWHPCGRWWCDVLGQKIFCPNGMIHPGKCYLFFLFLVHDSHSRCCSGES